MNQKTDRKMTDLLLAITHKDKPAVQRLIRDGANVNGLDDDGRPLLFYAATNGQIDASIITAMLKAGADVKARDKTGATALLAAVDPGGTPAIIKALLDRGAEVNSADLGGDTPLMRAASWDDSGNLKTLLSRGADPNKRQKQGRSALMIAARLGHAKAVEILLKAGADPTISDDGNQTALSLAEEEFAKDRGVVNDFEKNSRRRVLKMLRETPGIVRQRKRL